MCAAFVCCLLLLLRSLHSYWFLLDSMRFNDMLIAAAGSSWLLKPFSAYVRLTFCLRFSYIQTARAKPCENHCLANGNVKHMRKHIRIHTTGFELCTCCFCWLWNSTPFKVTKTNQKGNENKEKQHKINMKARVPNICYFWLTFLLTFLAGRLTFLLTFSYEVRAVLGTDILILS